MGQEQAEDVLVGGAQGPPLRDRLSPQWRRRVALFVALLLGIGIGALGTHLWHVRSGGGNGQPEFHLAATVSLAYRFNDQAMAVLDIHNLSDDPVIIHGMVIRLYSLRVIDNVWDSSPYPPVAVGGNHSHSVLTQLSADCSEQVGRRLGRAVYLASDNGESPERITDRLVRVSSDLRSFHDDVCGG
jgi:hypothetical protein